MASLKQKAIKGLSWDLSGTFAQQGISFIISVFLARLLGPTEFGLVGMALVFISVSQVFSDFGFASALIQNKRNTSLIYSSIFYINILAGITIFGIFQVIAPSIGKFYGNNEITNLVRWLSLNFIFTSLNQVQRTILRRNIDFKKLTIRSIIAQVVGGIFGIYCAFKGWGVYALVVQNLTASIFNTLILWRIADWYPRWEFSFAEVKKLSGFSFFVFLDRIASSVSYNVETFFIGKFFSPQALGYYTRADSLNNLVSKNTSASLTKVFFPVLSAVQDNDEQFNRIYLKVLSLIAFLSFLLSGLLILWGKTIIMTLFGEKWIPAILIFQILSIKAFAFPVNNMMVNAFMSKGKSKENFWIGIFRKAFRLVPLFVGYFYGLNALLWTMVANSILLTVTNVLFLDRYLHLSFYGHMRKLFEGAVPFSAFFVIKLFFFSGELSFLDNITASIVFVLVYFSFNYLIRNEGLIFVVHNYKLFTKRLT